MESIVEVRTKDELKMAQQSGYEEIVVLGNLAKEIYQARVFKTMSKTAVGTLLEITGIGAATAIPTGGLSVGVASALALPVAGVSTETLLLLVALGSVLVAIVKEYDMEYDFKRNRLILRKRR